MKLRTLSRSEWTRILEREYTVRPFASGGYEGYESLLVMKKIREPLKVKSGHEYVTIVEQGYSWLQIAAKDQSIWMTAMFDREDRFFQLYCDITAGNVTDADEPYFRDMYLDVIVTPTREVFVLDEDELDEALACGDITKVEYNTARAVCKRLAEWLENHTDEVIEYCKARQKALKA